VSAATCSLRPHGWQQSSRPWMASTGQLTRARTASVSARLEEENGASTNSRLVSALVSIAQLTMS
jgi:hypothetical protein